MPTALLAWELGGGAGHCVNLQPLARQLAARGWKVWVAARDVTTAGRVFQSVDVRHLQAPILLGRPANPVQPTRSFTHVLHNIGFGDDAQLSVLVASWWNLLEVVQPDVLVCEHAPTALLASRRYDVRRVVIGTGFFSPPNVSPLPEIRYWAPSADKELARDEAQILARINQLLAQHSLPPLSQLSELYADLDANFLLTFQELDHYPQRAGGEYWGMWSLPQKSSPAWPDGDGPRIFAYLKQLPSNNHMAAILATFREMRLPTLLQVTGADPAWLGRFHAPNLRFLSHPVDMRETARQCDLAILNGNAGTATELLLAGVPQLHVPVFLEQEVFSRRVVELGAALLTAPSRPEQFAVRLSTLVYERGRFQQAAQAFADRHAVFCADDSIREIVTRIVTSV